ncbi:MAG: methionine--tRNA ligase [Acidobacteriota bacterium]
MSSKPVYITTPIYYVNDRPHIGHVYTNLVADVLARFYRLRGDEVFYLTGTDEHAAKVVDSAAEHGVSAQEWADRNAAAFRETFERLQLTHDDFIRTSEARHKDAVTRYVSQLIASGDVYLGEYEGWYDAGQEEYVPETKAKELDFKSPINGKPLVRKAEKNYFFRLSRYQDELLELLESEEGPFKVLPGARRNEVVARIKDGLLDVPMSRTGAEDWGVKVPGDEEHTVYVWIDALFNYLSAVDTDDRRRYWPAAVHLLAKDILWFHAVIWPALLLALSRRPGNEWIGLPETIYVHSFWIRDGQKMSKSLGNFIDLEVLDGYLETFGWDGLRWFLATNGPLSTTDSDFTEANLVEIYNADLANTVGNCFSRVAHMTERYFDGQVPARDAKVEADQEYDGAAAHAVSSYLRRMERFDLAGAGASALELVRAVDGYIDKTRPFQLAKDPEARPQLATILYNCAEALRIAGLMLWPFLPQKAEQLWRGLGCGHLADQLANNGRGDLASWRQWGELPAGSPVSKGEGLFPRVDKKKYLARAEAASTSAAASKEANSKEAKAKQKGSGAAPKKKAKKEPGWAEQIDIQQFFETRLAVATVKAAEAVPKSSKLLKLRVEVGEEERTILAGIAKAYSPEDLVGRQVVVVANLAPAKLMGIESQGMVLAATADGNPVLLRPDTEVPSGTRVS